MKKGIDISYWQGNIDFSKWQKMWISLSSEKGIERLWIRSSWNM